MGRATPIGRSVSRPSGEEGPRDPEMLKGGGTYARRFSRVAHGRHETPVGRRRAAGQDAGVALKRRRGEA